MPRPSKEVNQKVVTLLFDNGGRIEHREDIMDTLRIGMYNYLPKDLAERCGCSVATIYKIRNGGTKWPRFHTLAALLTELGYTLYIKRGN